MVRTMWRVRARPGSAPDVESAWHAVANQIRDLPGNTDRGLWIDATDPGTFVLVTEWSDPAARLAFEKGPIATRFADAIRPLREEGDTYRVLRDPDGESSPIFVDVEMTVPPDRLAEFTRGYAEVAPRMAGIPGYQREELLHEPGSDRYHIFAEWSSEAEFYRWIANPAHAREEAGPIAPFLLEFRRRMFQVVTQAKEIEVHTTTDVLIVGAGPTGLTAAVELARRGIDCQVVEKRATPAGQADKAIGVHCRTMEIWEEQGIVREAMDAGIWLTGQMVWINGEETHRMSWELPELPYSHLGLPQYETERILTDRLATLGVRPRRGAALTGFTQSDDYVEATLALNGGGTETVRAKYLVGCDGAHSKVRELLGLTFTGGLGKFPQLFMLADADVDWDMPEGHLIRFMHETDGRMDNMLVSVPLHGKSRYRLATMAPPRYFAQTGGQDAPPGFSEELAEPALADVQAALDQMAPPGARAANLRWSSIFRISHGIVDRYAEGRVFVAGDAAHLHPPAGGQGMNTGIQDAWNLAWKLALAVRGIAAPGLLDSYETERRPEGEEIVGRAVRLAFTDELDRDDLKRQFLQEMSMLLAYSNSPIVDEFLSTPDALWDGPKPGDRAPDVAGLRRPGVGHPLRLRDLTGGTRHTLLIYADDAAGDLSTVEKMGAEVRRQASGEIDVYLILSPDARAPRLLYPPAVRDAGGEFRAAYDITGSALYLVRPDGHIGFRSQAIDSGALSKNLQLVFGSAT